MGFGNYGCAALEYNTIIYQNYHLLVIIKYYYLVISIAQALLIYKKYFYIVIKFGGFVHV